MSESKTDMEADISAAADGGEAVALMEPMVIAEGSRHRGALTDLAVEVAARSAGLHRSLPSGVRTALADLVLAMNCYYSNLIEGHDTDPIDIERTLNNDYSNDPLKNAYSRLGRTEKIVSTAAATGVSQGWYLTQLSSRLWIRAEYGLSHVASPVMSWSIKVISPIEISAAETISMEAAI